MDWIRLFRLGTSLPLSPGRLPLSLDLAGPEHRKRKGRKGRRCRKGRRRRKRMGILALVVAFLAGKCCGMKKRGCGAGGCNGGGGSSGCCCCCKSGGGCSS